MKRKEKIFFLHLPGIGITRPPKKTNRGAQYQCSFDSACQLSLRCTLTRVRSIFMALLLPGTHVLPTTETKMEDAVVDHLEFVHVNTSPGDCIVFSAWLLHRSRANRTASRDRSVYYVTYGNKGGLQEGVGSTNSGGGGGGAERSGAERRRLRTVFVRCVL